MKPGLKQIAEKMYMPTQSLFGFLTMCDVFAGKDSMFRIGGVLKDDETLELIDWWKKQHAEQKYTIQVFPTNCGYLNIEQNNGGIGLATATSILDFKTQFTKQEIDQLKQRDDLAIDWDKAKIEPVEDDE